jgi:manganese efflux pump family protein
MNKLKARWGITSNFQLAIIFIVFAINGSLSAKIGHFLLNLLGISNKNISNLIYYLLVIVIVLPIYPFLIMVVGFLFGQFKFFFDFGKKMLKSIGLGFIFKT